MSEIIFTDVSVRYYLPGKGGSSTNRVLTAIDNISLSICDGDRVGIIGRNGAGKSTLLSLIAGNIRPHIGSVVIDGEVLALINRTSGLLPQATLRENATLKGLSFNLKGHALTSYVSSVIESSMLSDRIDSKLLSLSTGMAGRFSIALHSQVIKPITVLDEWIGTLDVSGQQGNNLLNRLTHETELVVMASHNEHLIRQLCNRVLLLEQGTVVYDGSNFNRAFDLLAAIKKVSPDSQYSANRLKAYFEKYRAREVRIALLKRNERKLVLARKQKIQLKQVAVREKIELRKKRLKFRKKTNLVKRLKLVLQHKIEHERVRESSNFSVGDYTSAAGIEQKMPEHVVAPKKELHFINIGRTGIPAIQKALKARDLDVYKPIFHPITVRLTDIPEGQKICLIYRDPMSRFVSGFYSRKIEGAPYFEVPWTESESKMFEHFETPSMLLGALAEGTDTDSTIIAAISLSMTEYLSKGLTWYLKDEKYLSSRLDDIVLLRNYNEQSVIKSDLESLLGLKIDIAEFESDEKFVQSHSEALTSNAVDIFKKAYTIDTQLYSVLQNTSEKIGN